MVPQTGLALMGSHGIVLVPWISRTLWSGSAAEPPRSHRGGVLEQVQMAEAWPKPGQGPDFGNLGFGNPEIWGPKNKNKNSQNPNPFCPKCWQGLD